MPLTMHSTTMPPKAQPAKANAGRHGVSATVLGNEKKKNKESRPSIRQDETNRTESKGSPSGKAVENQKDKEGKP